jgi:hypothetical protein
MEQSRGDSGQSPLSEFDDTAPLEDVRAEREAIAATLLWRVVEYVLQDPSLTGRQRADLAKLQGAELGLARIDEILRTEDAQ